MDSKIRFKIRKIVTTLSPGAAGGQLGGGEPSFAPPRASTPTLFTIIFHFWRSLNKKMKFLTIISGYKQRFRNYEIFGYIFL